MAGALLGTGGVLRPPTAADSNDCENEYFKRKKKYFLRSTNSTLLSQMEENSVYVIYLNFKFAGLRATTLISRTRQPAI
jgi:hypothetical protein